MKTFNEIKTIASSYVKDKVNDMALISEPLLRVENNKLCLGYFFVEFNDEQKKDYRVKRPTKWLTQDMISGIIIDVLIVEKKIFLLQKYYHIISYILMMVLVFCMMK